MNIAEKIRQETREELGLTVSIGVSFNKVFAKLGSDMKKPDAITEIRSDEFKEKVWPLNVNEMIYCGPATTKKLARFGVVTIGQLAQLDPGFYEIAPRSKRCSTVAVCEWTGSLKSYAQRCGFSGKINRSRTHLYYESGK